MPESDGFTRATHNVELAASSVRFVPTLRPSRAGARRREQKSNVISRTEIRYKETVARHLDYIRGNSLLAVRRQPEAHQRRPHTGGL